jgi:hypothetical protein
MLASFIDRSPSVSASLSPSSIEPSTHSTSATTLQSIRRLRSLLTTRVAAYVERRLHAICEDIEYDANCLRQTADEEFLAIVAEEKLDIEQRQQNALEEFDEGIQGLVNKKLDELDDEVDGLVEQAEQKVADAIDAKASKYMNRTWNKALTQEILDPNARVEYKAARRGHAGGDRKRKFHKFRWCER